MGLGRLPDSRRAKAAANLRVVLMQRPLGKSRLAVARHPLSGGGMNSGGHLYRQLSRVSTIRCSPLYIKHPPSGEHYSDTGIWMAATRRSTGPIRRRA